MNFDPRPAAVSSFLAVVQVVLVMAPGFWYTLRVSKTSSVCGMLRPLPP